VTRGDELRALGQAVAARRGELGMTQQQLADTAGVDLKTVYNLESGSRWPIAKNRAAIAAALGWVASALTELAASSLPVSPTTPRRRVLPELEIGPDEEAEVARYRLVVDAERDARFPARNAQESVVWETDLLDEAEKRSLVALLRHMEDRVVRQRDENSG
jgi:transcriptional regulator with XRE-family HTH domain